ncbi:MAG: OadG family protein [Clostridia bacterium]|nr:OadG family protein [Clostridia bacterium]
MTMFLEAMSFGDSLISSLVGILIVFIGLICLIALVTIMGAISQKLLSGEKSAKPAQKKAAAPAPAAKSGAAKSGTIENRDELVAIFSAAVAEELGTDVSAIRVVSLKEIG